MIQASRRSFIAGAVALVAAPAIVRVASLMQVAPTETLVMPRNSLLTINEITREAVKLFSQSNQLLRELDAEYERDVAFYQGEQWTPDQVRAFRGGRGNVGDALRIRLPNDYVLSDGPRMPWQSSVAAMKSVEQAVAPLALAAAAVAVAPALLEKPVTRRFWSK